jgi:hypothetical protein
VQAIPVIGVADTRLEPQTALALAEQVLATPRGLMSTFNMSKVHAEVTQRQPTGFAYRSYVKSLGLRMRMNDGYVIAQDGGQGATRLSFHENKRYAMIAGGIFVAVVVINLLIYFLTAPSSTPPPVAPGGFGGGGFGAQPVPAPSTGGVSRTVFLISTILILIFGSFQIWDVLTSPKKVVELFNQRQMYGGGPPGFPGQPQPGFPGQPQPGFAGQGQPGMAPPPQPGFPPPPQPGFAPPQPASAPGMPPPQPGGFPPPPLQAGIPPQPAGFPPPPQAPQPQPGAVGNADKLRELAQLRDSGIISPAEYEQAKAAIEGKAS